MDVIVSALQQRIDQMHHAADAIELQCKHATAHLLNTCEAHDADCAQLLRMLQLHTVRDARTRANTVLKRAEDVADTFDANADLLLAYASAAAWHACADAPCFEVPDAGFVHIGVGCSQAESVLEHMTCVIERDVSPAHSSASGTGLFVYSLEVNLFTLQLRDCADRAVLWVKPEDVTVVTNCAMQRVHVTFENDAFTVAYTVNCGFADQLHGSISVHGIPIKTWTAQFADMSFKNVHAYAIPSVPGLSHYDVSGKLAFSADASWFAALSAYDTDVTVHDFNADGSITLVRGIVDDEIEPETVCDIGIVNGSNVLLLCVMCVYDTYSHVLFDVPKQGERERPGLRLRVACLNMRTNQHLIACSDYNQILLVSYADWAVTHTIDTVVSGLHSSIGVSCDADYVACIDASNESVLVFDAVTGACISQIRVPGEFVVRACIACMRGVVVCVASVRHRNAQMVLWLSIQAGIVLRCMPPCHPCFHDFQHTCFANGRVWFLDNYMHTRIDVLI